MYHSGGNVDGGDGPWEGRSTCPSLQTWYLVKDEDVILLTTEQITAVGISSE